MAKEEKLKIVEARVTADLHWCGHVIKPNSIVLAHEAVLKAYPHSLDATPEAVAYVREHEGADMVIDLDSLAADAAIEAEVEEG